VKALLVVCTNPADAAHEDEYNRWYTEEHLPDVLAIPGYVRATRYRMVEPPPGDAAPPFPQRYLALYELDVADLAALQAVSDEHMRQIAAGEQRRSPPGTMDAEAMRALYYAGVGDRVGDADDVPESVFLVFSDPSSPDAESEFHRWYQDVHLGEVVAVRGFEAGSRWERTGINMLHRPWVAGQRFLAVYELSVVRDELGEALGELTRRATTGDAMQMSATLGPGLTAVAFTRVSPRVSSGR
jgi:hypothetical protein